MQHLSFISICYLLTLTVPSAISTYIATTGWWFANLFIFVFVYTYQYVYQYQYQFTLYSLQYVTHLWHILFIKQFVVHFQRWSKSYLALIIIMKYHTYSWFIATSFYHNLFIFFLLGHGTLVGNVHHTKMHDNLSLPDWSVESAITAAGTIDHQWKHTAMCNHILLLSADRVAIKKMSWGQTHQHCAKASPKPLI